MSERDRLRQRFAGVKRQPATKRRPDYKGRRVQMSVRLPPDVAEGLEILKFATGVEKNDLVVAAIRDAVNRRLADARGNFDDADWEVVVRCARAGAPEKPGD